MTTDRKTSRYWIENRHDNGWVDVEGQRLIVDAAPRFRFALGWRLDQLAAYCQRRHWTFRREGEYGRSGSGGSDEGAQ